MEVEKRGVKGGFFQLFDWNSKSRKKLFSSKSELPESSNQAKDNLYSSTIARHEHGLENGFSLGTRTHNDYHYASSASGDSEYGTKAPGVVARLMGLDSLPKSTLDGPRFTPFLDSHSFRDSNYVKPVPTFHSEQDIVIFESVRNKLDGLSINPLDMRLQKVQNRPIERFQSEVLPPKSAKPISVTHHRLLSPIKSPGFIPPKNAAYIIEAAAKIIEQSPRSTCKSKFPSIGSSSSLPSRARDVKEKMEATQKTPIANKHMTKRSEDCYSYKGSEESKGVVGSQRSKSKEKSCSLAVEAKVNIQKRDGSCSVGNKQKEYNGMRQRNVLNTEKKMEKQSSSRKPSDVLKLNNQKQNCASVKTRENSETSFSQIKNRKESNLSNSNLNGRTNRTVNKSVPENVVTSRKTTNVIAADPGKDLSLSRTRTISKRKFPISGDIQSDGDAPQKQVLMKDEKSVTCNISFEGDSRWDVIDKKNSLDVVSFTFTSPIKKSGAESNSLSKILHTNDSSFSNCDSSVFESDDSKSCDAISSGFNVMNGRDSLSVLLEQKLKELTSRIESSQQGLSEAGSFSNSINNYGNVGSSVNLENSLLMNDDVLKGKLEIHDLSKGKQEILAETENKGLEYMENNGNYSTNEYQRRNFHLSGSSSVSGLPSFSENSRSSFDVGRSPSNESCSMQGVSVESFGWSSTRNPYQAEADVEMSDSASSLSLTTISETITSTLYTQDSKDSSYWELQYIIEILSIGKFMFKEFALGQAEKIISPDLFDQLENQKTGRHKEMEEQFTNERKVLFDCISECLEVRCERVLGGGYDIWSKQIQLLNKNEWLAEEMYREISSWINDEELMVDELVDKDMSCKNGKWIDFELEAFEEGAEIEKRILSSLVDELIDDFLF